MKDSFSFNFAKQGNKVLYNWLKSAFDSLNKVIYADTMRSSVITHLFEDKNLLEVTEFNQSLIERFIFKTPVSSGVIRISDTALVNGKTYSFIFQGDANITINGETYYKTSAVMKEYTFLVTTGATIDIYEL